MKELYSIADVFLEGGRQHQEMIKKNFPNLHMIKSEYPWMTYLLTGGCFRRCVPVPCPNRGPEAPSSVLALLLERPGVSFTDSPQTLVECSLSELWLTIQVLVEGVPTDILYGLDLYLYSVKKVQYHENYRMVQIRGPIFRVDVALNCLYG